MIWKISNPTTSFHIEIQLIFISIVIHFMYFHFWFINIIKKFFFYCLKNDRAHFSSFNWHFIICFIQSEIFWYGSICPITWARYYFIYWYHPKPLYRNNYMEFFFQLSHTIIACSHPIKKSSMFFPIKKSFQLYLKK